MSKYLVTTKTMHGMRVLGGKDGSKKIGKIHQFVFHPKAKRLVGFIVKRPDLALMFHRKDLFLSIEGYDMVDGRMVIRNAKDATGDAACKALGVDWNECVLWVGLPVMTEDGTSFGMVGDVTFDRKTGAVDSFEVTQGATTNAVLGTRVVPADLIRGFRTGMGAALTQSSNVDAHGEEGEISPDMLGAILVDNSVKHMQTEGGVAEKAGHAAAIAADKVENTVKPAVSNAAAATGKAVNKGAYATGKQLGKSKTMFSDFKEEYDKARGPKPAPRTDSTVAKKPAGAAAKKPASAAAKKPTGTAAKTAASKKPAAKKPAKNMFAAFKDEFDKASK